MFCQLEKTLSNMSGTELLSVCLDTLMFLSIITMIALHENDFTNLTF